MKYIVSNIFYLTFNVLHLTLTFKQYLRLLKVISNRQDLSAIIINNLVQTLQANKIIKYLINFNLISVRKKLLLTSKFQILTCRKNSERCFLDLTDFYHMLQQLHKKYFVMINESSNNYKETQKPLETHLKMSYVQITKVRLGQ